MLVVRYVDVPITESVVLRNITDLPAEFKWGVLNPAKDTCKLTFSQRKGIVEPNSSKQIDVTFTPLAAVRFELLCVCEVTGMPEPTGFLLTSLARGLILSFVNVDDEEAREIERLHGKHQEPNIKSVRNISFFNFSAQIVGLLSVITQTVVCVN